ncbi:MAG: tetratricopeptide repeat protein [Candidatus Hydrogenedentes bacterium]|nr:tetratricopeptide repeat protein [Candidatus Hydrogenedentota bacterium]
MGLQTISAAIIAKDEAEQLPECLQALAGWIDEVYLLDTGSRDDTPAIAHRYGAKVGHFSWNDDFSAARNASLDGCTCDWILIVDADERIAAADTGAVRALADGPASHCYRFVTRNYTNQAGLAGLQPCAKDDPLARGFAGWHPSVKVRLFPNHAGARFEGKVHELVNRSLETRGIAALLCDVPIHHYPFAKAPERVRAKQEMYLRLGLAKVADAPDDPNAYAELGNAYLELGDYPGATNAFREALKYATSNAALLKDLGSALYLMQRRDESRRAFELAVKIDARLADAWRNLGVLHADAREWPQALACFEQALAGDPTWADGPRYIQTARDALRA